MWCSRYSYVVTYALLALFPYVDSKPYGYDPRYVVYPNGPNSTGT